MGINDSIVESKHQITYDRGRAIIYLIKDMKDVAIDPIAEFEQGTAQHCHTGMESAFSKGISTLNRYIRNLF